MTSSAEAPPPTAFLERFRGPRARVGQLFGADGPPVRWYVAVVITVAAAVLAFFRLGHGALHGKIWAEDGGIFLQQAIRPGGPRAFTTTYAGYLHSVPRTIAAVVQLLPVRYWAVALHLSAAGVVGVLAAVVYASLAHLVPARIARLFVAFYFALVPVGPEIIDSIANLQWYVLPAATMAALWTPRTCFGWVVAGVLIFAGTTCSPLGGAVLLVTLVRLVARPSRPVVSLAVVAAIGFVVQTAAMIFGTPRRHSGGDRGKDLLLARGYLMRVVGDSVLGIGRSLPSGHLAGARTGALVVLVVVLAGLAVTVVRRGRVSLLAPAGFLVLSVVTYVIAAVSVHIDFTSTIFKGRYYAIPAVFFVVALVVFFCGRTGPATLATAHISASGAAPSTVGAVARWLPRVLASVGGVVVVVAVVTSYQLGAVKGRDTGTPWTTSVQQARTQCLEPVAGRTKIVIRTGREWTIAVPCSRLTG